MTLLPTQLRYKLRRGLSYPVGAEILSSQLEGVPQFGEITLYFRGPERPKPTPRLPFNALRASFSFLRPGLSSSTSFIERGWHDPKWDVSVAAVPSASRRQVRQCLIAEGIPAIRKWLSAPRPDTWYEGRKTITISVDPQEEHVKVSESEAP